MRHRVADPSVQGGSLLTGTLGSSSGPQVGIILEKGSWCSAGRAFSMKKFEKVRV